MGKVGENSLPRVPRGEILGEGGPHRTARTARWRARRNVAGARDLARLHLPASALEPSFGMHPGSSRVSLRDVSDWREAFFERCCEESDGATIGEGAFGAGPALWVGKREVAHFDAECTLDVRLTKTEIRRRRDELNADARVTLRGNSSDWLELRVASDEDVEWAVSIVAAAVETNRPTAPAGLPPTGSDLERRRRFH